MHLFIKNKVKYCKPLSTEPTPNRSPASRMEAIKFKPSIPHRANVTVPKNNCWTEQLVG